MAKWVSFLIIYLSITLPTSWSLRHAYLNTKIVHVNNEETTTPEVEDDTTDETAYSEETTTEDSAQYGNSKRDETFTNSLFMDPDNKYFVQWKINETHIIFEVQVETLGWVGLGISPGGGMPNADMAVMWIKNGKLTIQDRFARGYFEPDLDTEQDFHSIFSKENSTHTIVRFARALDTCDKMDQKITKDTIHLLYAYHSEDPTNEQLMKHEHKGQKSVILLDGSPQFVEPKYTRKLTFTVNKYSVPSVNHTTYHCTLHQLTDLNEKYYIVGNKPLIQPENIDYVHHILVHLCEPSFKNEKKIKEYLCYEENPEMMLNCFTNLLTAWAVGADGFVYPKDVGFPLHKDMNGRWVNMEIHYNNPGYKEGIVDSSGFEFYLTKEKVKIESGQLALGFTEFQWSLLLPPGQKEFSSTSFCSQECLEKVDIPEDGLNIFSYMLHSHLAGRKIRIKIIRDGKELEPIMRDDNYDFNFQVNRSPSKITKLYKGDAIAIECIYSTEDRANYTTSGLSTKEEMCLAYIYYYPAAEFTLCGSAPTYESMLKGMKSKIKTSLNAIGSVLRPFSDPELVELKTKVLAQMNSKKWKSESGIEKLKEVYKKADYHTVCQTGSGLPSLDIKKMLKFEEYKSPSLSSCEAE